MKVLVVGAGAREHALADALGRTADEVVVTPGNPGIPGSPGAADPVEIEADLVVVGPEEPLVDGLADRLRARGRLVLGPGADGARLEGSKAWMKEVLAETGVPTASSRAFAEVDAALAHLGTLGPPFVVKTDGLAAGKGVLVTQDRAEAQADLRAKLAGTSFGPAGRTVVIEEGLVGPELSVLALCDGARAVPLAPARDHKRIGEAETGANTGGMGAFSPVLDLPAGTVDRVMDEAVLPTLHALRRRGIDYRGVLYAGLMLTADGVKVIEFNVRFADPETQAVLARLDADLVALCAEAANGRLRTEPTFVDDAAVTVVVAAEGYPAAPRSGDPIEGVAEVDALDGVRVHCYGARTGDDGGLVTASGRVLDVTALAPTVAEARDRAYDGVGRIRFRGKYARRDIAA
ncbi:MAG: phosphoribosylamine--glycine ligase [Acidimicrobiia bacterium]|nr:phosphoribosylamine--glycine ligase [Acidimicrobiia bacterium]